MSIKILKQGVQSTLQDTGRSGHRNIGIGSGGAMDEFAAAVSNFLVGNDAYKAVMEINFPAPEILFQQDAFISLTGADFSVSVNNIALQYWRPLFIYKGSIMKFNRPVYGSKAYLGVAGGWVADNWLGSYSTHLKVNAGGFQGRALEKGDIIEWENTNVQMRSGRLNNWSISQKELDKIYQPAYCFRCIRSAEWDWLDNTSKDNFSQQQFFMSHQSDRMGYRFTAVQLDRLHGEELVSSAVDAGTMQLLPDGNVIVLMADCQTTGGYPRIASVVKADMPKFSQLVPGKKIKFELESLDEAEDALISMYRLMNEIKESCMLNFNK